VFLAGHRLQIQFKALKLMRLSLVKRQVRSVQERARNIKDYRFGFFHLSVGVWRCGPVISFWDFQGDGVLRWGDYVIANNVLNVGHPRELCSCYLYLWNSDNKYM
jgi:hypothetical protein